MTRGLLLAIGFFVGCDCGALRRHAAGSDSVPGLDAADDGGRAGDAGDATVADDAGTDAADDAGPDGGDAGPTATEFVLASVLFGDLDDGFDLDDHDTRDREDPVGCGHLDGEAGVDNQLGPVMDDVDELLEINSKGKLAAAVEGGVLLMLFRLHDLDDRDDDDDVDVHVFNGVDEDDDASNNLDGEGRFYVHSESVEDGDEARPRVNFEHGALVDQVFEGGPVDFQVTLPLGPDFLVPITMRDAQLRFHLYRTRFVDGLVGGAVPVTQIVDAVREDPDFADSLAFVEIALYSNADMDLLPEGPTGDVCADDGDCERGQSCVDLLCDEPAGRCDALSGAVRITGVRAEILGVAAPK